MVSPELQNRNKSTIRTCAEERADNPLGQREGGGALTEDDREEDEADERRHADQQRAPHRAQPHTCPVESPNQSIASS